MTTLEPAWTRGPYEKQETTEGTPYQPLPVTLPNMMNHVHGARKARRRPLNTTPQCDEQLVAMMNLRHSD